MPEQALVLLLAQMMACVTDRRSVQLLGLIMAALVHSENLSQTHLAFVLYDGSVVHIT